MTVTDAEPLSLERSLDTRVTMSEMFEIQAMAMSKVPLPTVRGPSDWERRTP